ncbi:HVO_2922 family protein [Haloplanus salilacus]|uniref:HVO_2922 family protein n=1 Tax=Haloplanus salilacus TaxID=2949994 RepID=UPI0030D1CC6B
MPNARFELFVDAADEWRWRLVASNGNIIADSGEGYSSKQGAKRGIESVKRVAADAAVSELEE